MYVLKIMQVFEIGLVIEIKTVLNWESKTWIYIHI